MLSWLLLRGGCDENFPPAFSGIHGTAACSSATDGSSTRWSLRHRNWTSETPGRIAGSVSWPPTSLLQCRSIHHAAVDHFATGPRRQTVIGIHGNAVADDVDRAVAEQELDAHPVRARHGVGIRDDAVVGQVGTAMTQDQGGSA